jgi:hypothetical protein
VTDSFKLYVKVKNKQRRLAVLVDREDFFEYRNKILKILPGGKIYFSKNKQKKMLQREILQLTQPYMQVFSKSGDNFDCRKQNLGVTVTPECRRGQYSVQFLDDPKD